MNGGRHRVPNDTARTSTNAAALQLVPDEGTLRAARMIDVWVLQNNDGVECFNVVGGICGCKGKSFRKRGTCLERLNDERDHHTHSR
jgi:hypothetical protein